VKPISKQDRPCAYKRNFEARLSNTFCRGKAISITYSECMFVVLFIQYAKRMRRFILWYVAQLSVQYSAHYLINGTVFEKKILNVK
jgi:hypothetical protein